MPDQVNKIGIKSNAKEITEYLYSSISPSPEESYVENAIKRVEMNHINTPTISNLCSFCENQK